MAADRATPSAPIDVRTLTAVLIPPVLICGGGSALFLACSMAWGAATGELGDMNAATAAYFPFIALLFFIFPAAIVAAAVGLCAMLAFILPAHLLLQALNLRHVLIYLAVGVLAGLLAVALPWGRAIHILNLRLEFGLNPGEAAFGSVLGGAMGIAFWLIRRPDRDGRPTHVITSP